MDSLDELTGKNLICHCAPEKCHADVLLRLANENPFTQEEIDATNTLSAAQTRLSGEVIVFTNFRDADMEDKLKRVGATIAESVTKTTTCLVVPDGNQTTTGKVAKAEKYGIKIMEKSAFRNAYKV